MNKNTTSNQAKTQQTRNINYNNEKYSIKQENQKNQASSKIIKENKKNEFFSKNRQTLNSLLEANSYEKTSSSSINSEEKKRKKKEEEKENEEEFFIPNQVVNLSSNLNNEKISMKTIIEVEEIHEIIYTIKEKKTVYNDLDLDNRINLLLFNDINQKKFFDSFSSLTEEQHRKLITFFTKYPNKIFKKTKSLNLLIQYYNLSNIHYRTILISKFKFHVISAFPNLYKNIKVFLNNLKSDEERFIIYSDLISVVKKSWKKLSWTAMYVF